MILEFFVRLKLLMLNICWILNICYMYACVYTLEKSIMSKAIFSIKFREKTFTFVVKHLVTQSYLLIYLGLRSSPSLRVDEFYSLCKNRMCGLWGKFLRYLVSEIRNLRQTRARVSSIKYIFKKKIQAW